jgi:hypothetical protein
MKKEYTIPTEKICKRCSVLKPMTEFYPESRKLDGRRTSCIICDKAYYQEYRQRPNKTKRTVREDKASPFGDRTIEHDIFCHFHRFGKKLTVEQTNDIVARLKVNKSLYNLTQIEEEFGCHPDMYQMDHLETLRQARESANTNRPKFNNAGTGVKVGVIQYDLEGELIAHHESLKEASVAITGSPTKAVGSISNCASGTTLKAFNFVWAYI